MRIVGVIDLAGGAAVHARGGDRARYAAVQVACGRRVEGDSVALARAYAEAGANELYVADLDAITGKPLQRSALLALAACGLPLWVDAGVTAPAAATAVVETGASQVIVGLETLPAFEALDAVVASVGARRSAFSLDLRGDVPLATRGLGEVAITGLVQRAITAGVGSMIVIDVARVGTAAGPNLPLLRSIRGGTAGLTLLVGGGVRDDADVQQLAREGIQGVLVATALQQGRIHTRLAR